MTKLFLLLVILALGMIVYWAYVQISNVVKEVEKVVNNPFGLF